MRSSQAEMVVGKDPENESGLVLESPAVGLYDSAPMVGEVVVGGSRAGVLTSLGRRIDLVVPKGVTGRVAEACLTTHRDPVEYGQVLLRLVPVEAGDDSEASVSEAGPTNSGLPEGTLAVLSPPHGMFYRRPRPDEPQYVEIGQIVETGATLALVEVMKCFSAIVYGGPDLPDRAEIVEVRADDGAEVGADEILFVVRPA